MTLSIWRYSHLILAMVSSLFLLVASITGLVLAVEPISNTLRPYRLDGADALPLVQVLDTLDTAYDEVLSIARDRNGFVSISAIVDGQHRQFYIDPFTGRELGPPIEKAPIFQFCTSLHRSLFLKSTGRLLVGLVSFLLFLIVISGVVLIAKRQGGMRHFFAPVVREGFSQFNHVVYARISLLPVLILAVTGVYLSLLRFDVITEEPMVHDIDFGALREEPNRPFQDFEVFHAIPLGQLRELEFPFSDFVEDYYTIRLKDREVVLNQFTGDIITEKQYSFATMVSSWATVLHTGEGSVVWSIILGLGSLSIPFLTVTGFVIFFKRSKVRIKNRFSKSECDHVLLVGTEGGTTLSYALAFHKQLLKAGIKSYLGLMNDYGPFPNMRQLVVITATYGQGEAPSSAGRFVELLAKHPPSHPFGFSVVGFGSTAYPQFCQYAHEVYQLLDHLGNARSHGEVFTVNNKSFEAFLSWVKQWATLQHLSLHLEKPTIHSPKGTNCDFEVLDRVDLKAEDTFLLTLKSTVGAKATSGDLLSIVPKEDGRERLYSLGSLGKGQLVLSVKKHPDGICSNRLGRLVKGERLSASVVKNPSFHLPKGSKETVMIATGTGIGPFLGMVASNTAKRKIRLYWGGRTPESLDPYRSYIDGALTERRLDHFIPAYSRLHTEKIYVQHLIEKDGSTIAGILHKGGCVMICGSIAMQRAVVQELKKICAVHLSKDLSYYQNRMQIRMDCY